MENKKESEKEMIVECEFEGKPEIEHSNQAILTIGSFTCTIDICFPVGSKTIKIPISLLGEKMSKMFKTDNVCFTHKGAVVIGGKMYEIYGFGC